MPDKAKAAEASFQMSAAHLARTLESARGRVRRSIAQLIEDHGDAALGEGKNDLGLKLHEIAEEVRGLGLPKRAAEPDPLDNVEERAGLSAGDASLPPVRHHDDFEEGEALVRNLGARGRAFARD